MPRAGSERRLEQAISELARACARFPGYLRLTIMRPALPGQPGFRLIYQFETVEQLRAWEECEEQQRLIERANLYTQGEPRHHAESGLEAWLTASPAAALLRAKMTLVSWLGVFPLLYLFTELVDRLMPAATPPVVRVLIVSVLAVATMSYLVGPWLTQLLRGWLR